MGNDWVRVQEIFQRVIAASPPDRSAVLEDACGDDETLRRDVESLLHHHDATASFIDESPFHALTDLPDHDPPPRLIGATIGGFTVTGRIGAGGMGAVYLAMQDTPRREVALKVMRPGMISRSALRRFKLESHVLGRLHHPNIAQVYDAGTYDDGRGGVPYFAMEHIEGARPITAYAESERLGTRQRLRMFLSVCDAVHHGHQKGVIHRDLTPNNILVDRVGEPKIIDFGVARATDADLMLTTLQTDVGQFLGTLQYMSPEQCSAGRVDVDTRSDVYTLGLVLFELLTGERPYDLSGVHFTEAVRVIREEMPRRPSTIRRVLRGDLETIVLKAMAKDRDRRYDSAAALADDIERYLANEPIKARPPSLSYQARMYARRHRTMTAVVIATMLTLVAATVVSFVLYWNARAELRALSEARYRGLVRFIDGQDWEPSPAQMIGYWPVPLDAVSFDDSVGACMAKIDGVNRLFFIDEEGRPTGRGEVGPTSLIVPSQVSRDLHGLARFRLQRCLLADMVNDIGGPEFMVSLAHEKWYPTTIRLCDREFDVQGEVWSGGHVPVITWNGDHRLVIFVGIVNRLSHLYAPGDRSDQLVGHYPSLLFAFDPDDIRGRRGVLFPLRGDQDLPAILPRWAVELVPPSGDPDSGWRNNIVSVAPPESAVAAAACQIRIQYARTPRVRRGEPTLYFTAHLDTSGHLLAEDGFRDEQMQTPGELGLPPPKLRLIDRETMKTWYAAQDLVDRLVTDRVPPDEWSDAIRERSELDYRVSAAAVALCEQRSQIPGWLSGTAWSIAVDDDVDPSDYSYALDLARRASELIEPSDASLQQWIEVVVGLCAHRCGDHDTALVALQSAGAADDDCDEMLAVVYAIALAGADRHDDAARVLARDDIQQWADRDVGWTFVGRQLMAEASSAVQENSSSILPPGR